MPITAKKMNKTGNYQVSKYKTWYQNPKEYSRKAYLMRRHFNEIKKADAILVINLKKKGVDGYVGGNVLMEMGLAFYLRKPIYLWRDIARYSAYYEEVLGMQPIFVHEKFDEIV